MSEQLQLMTGQTIAALHATHKLYPTKYAQHIPDTIAQTACYHWDYCTEYNCSWYASLSGNEHEEANYINLYIHPFLLYETITSRVLYMYHESSAAWDAQAETDHTFINRNSIDSKVVVLSLTGNVRPAGPNSYLRQLTRAYAAVERRLGPAISATH